MTDSTAIEHEEFLVETNSPKKLVEYFIENFVIPQEDLGRNNIKINEREIMIRLQEDKVNFTVLVDNGYIEVLRVEFVDFIPRNVDLNISLGKSYRKLELIHLKEMMDEINNN